jgi:hypothetical protein
MGTPKSTLKGCLECGVRLDGKRSDSRFCSDIGKRRFTDTQVGGSTNTLTRPTRPTEALEAASRMEFLSAYPRGRDGSETWCTSNSGTPPAASSQNQKAKITEWSGLEPDGRGTARLMQAYQEALLTLQRIRAGGKQTVVVQHVQVSEGRRRLLPEAEVGGGGLMAGRGRLRKLREHPMTSVAEYWRSASPSSDFSRAARCGAKTRRGTSCQCPAMPKGRCRLHGGHSTGPKTQAGIERSGERRRSTASTRSRRERNESTIESCCSIVGRCWQDL